MINKSTIDQVFDTARVEEVIGDFVQLKKAGSNFKGLSPFTDERTPSFMVSPVKQIWKDFSSGKGGNVVAFLMEHEHFTYPEAIKYLAKKYNIEVEETEQSEEQKQQADERESMYLVNEFAQKYFQNTLNKTDQGKAIGLSYFKERGFLPETIENFKLGYSPDEWEAFTSEALKKGYKLEFLEKTGLTIVKENGKNFDRFKGRVMFPIHSMSGRVLGFGGRILKNDKKAAKYLNSPESEIYHKSKVLYGIFQAKQAIAKEDLCYLVEGYTDVIQFHQSGIENTVASSGTALTSEQIHLVHRLTKNITVLFDGDAAGQRASLRGIDLILEQGLNVKVCSFPEGEDPDSFAKSHSEEEIRDYLTENAMDFINYKAMVLLEESKGDPVKKADTIRDMVVSISKIPEAIKQEIYIRETAQRMDISEEVLFSTLAQIKAKEATQKGNPVSTQKSYDGIKKVEEPKTKVDPQYELERIILGLLLRYGPKKGEFRDFVLKESEKGGLELSAETQEAKVYEKIYLDLQEDEIEFANEGFRDLYYKIMKEFTENENLKIDQFVNQIEPEQATVVTSILMGDDQNRLHDWERKNIFVKDKSELEPREINETILNLRRFLIKKKVDELGENLKEKKEEQDLETLREAMDYKNLEVLISDKLNRVT
jgi:DNA primase